MNRREFLTASTAVALAPLAIPNLQAESTGGARQYYELRQYILDNDAQKRGLDDFLAQVAIPSLNRLGIKQVGVFHAKEGSSPVTVLVPHPTLESVATLPERLEKDTEFMKKGAGFLDATKAAPVYKRFESSLLRAFTGMPGLETPPKVDGRVVQLRIYESPTFKAGRKKIEMFNEAGEIKIFREVGLNPVFFAETLIGPRMPSLTYMLAFESEDHLKAAWKKFGAHPDWQKLKALSEYADKTILTNIVNTVLTPAPYSQI